MRIKEFLNIKRWDCSEQFRLDGIPMCLLPPSKSDVARELTEYYNGNRNIKQMRLLVRHYHSVRGDWNIPGFHFYHPDNNVTYIVPDKLKDISIEYVRIN